MTNRPRLAVDMDEVIADSHGAQRRWLGDRFGYVWTDEDLRGRNLDDLISPEHAEAMSTMLSNGTIYSEFEVIADSQEMLQNLSRHYEIYIATAAMEYPNSVAFKYQWLRKHFDFLEPLNFVFCGHKNIINADFLIDDNERHLKKFEGRGIVFSALHNTDLTGYRRLDNWKMAQSLLEELASI